MKIQEEWVIARNTDIGRIAKRWKIFQLYDKKTGQYHMTGQQVSRCLIITEGKKELFNPVLTDRQARAIKII